MRRLVPYLVTHSTPVPVFRYGNTFDQAPIGIAHADDIPRVSAQIKRLWDGEIHWRRICPAGVRSQVTAYFAAVASSFALSGYT